MIDRSASVTAPITVAASQTDSALVSAVSGSRIKVLGFWSISASTSTFVFNSKGSGAGTAISPVLTPTANQSFQMSNSDAPLFQTNKGEGLTLTTGAGGNTVLIVTYVVV